MFLQPVERFLFIIICALAIFDIIAVNHKSISLDITGYAISLAMGLVPLIIGQYYRFLDRDERLGTVLTASGLYILFSIFASIFNYMFLPISFAPIDAILIKTDGLMGYSWPTIVTLAASYPWAGTALYFVYMTTLPQLLVILIVLGFTGQQKRLHCFLVTGTIGALLSISFWVIFPTFGAKAYHSLPEWVTLAIPLAVNPAYGQELMRLGAEGVQYLSPANILGLIGFPSFHIFMALMSFVFVPRHVFFIVTIGTLNILMLPAVLVQGGHHLTDIFGGIAFFAIVYPISRSIVNALTKHDTPTGASQVSVPVTNG
ncbi:phosphatase PAP2 family protein [Agrobacterium sp. CG674]